MQHKQLNFLDAPIASPVDLNYSLTDDKYIKGVVSEYSPQGTASRNLTYYRFSYRDGKKVKHRHIPGGQVGTLTAESNKKHINYLISQEFAPDEIVLRISRLPKASRKKR